MSEDTDDRLDAIRAMLAAATPGPWEYLADADLVMGDDHQSIVADPRHGCGRGEANAALIAHAPDDLAWLVGEVERLRGATLTPLEDARLAVLHETERLEAEVERLRAERDACPMHAETLEERERADSERHARLCAQAEVARLLMDRREGVAAFWETAQDAERAVARAERAERERDEARSRAERRAEDARQWCDTSTVDAPLRDMVYEWARMDTRGTTPFRELGTSCIAALVGIVSRFVEPIRRERDAAREETARLRDVQADLLRCPERAMEVTRERDAAVARVARLEKALREIETHDPDVIVPGCECETYTDCLRETRDRARRALAGEE